MTKRIEIFRGGKRTDSNGNAFEFTDSLLQGCVDAYDPELHEAPIVIGHPKDNEPAYGWVKSLSFADSVLGADPHQVDADFAELVNKGRYKKISASFYLPDAPRNPKPGSLYLRHVGFLGAVPPAIKGLNARRQMSFADNEQGVAEFSDWGDVQQASMWRRMREFIIEKFSSEDADKVIPGYAVEALESDARNKPNPISYTEPTESGDMTPDEIKAEKEKLAAERAALTAREQTVSTKEASFSEREQSLSSKERDAKRAAHVGYADEQIKAGKLLPVQKDAVVAFMSSLDSSGVVEFGEGDAKKSITGVEYFKQFLSELPKVVSFGENVRDDKDAPVDTSKGEAIASAALEFQESERKSGRDITVVDAIQHVMKQAAQ